MRIFPDFYISHMILSCLSCCPSQHAHFRCVQFPLVFFLTAQHSGPYIMAGYIAVLYTLFFNFVGIFLSHIILLFTSFSAPLLASNMEPRYLNVFTVFTSFS